MAKLRIMILGRPTRLRVTAGRGPRKSWNSLTADRANLRNPGPRTAPSAGDRGPRTAQLVMQCLGWLSGGWLACWLPDWLDGWVAGQLGGWVAGWLSGWDPKNTKTIVFSNGF